MTEPAPKGHRRRRHHRGAQPDAARTPDTAAGTSQGEGTGRGRREPTDRGLRDLVGGGPSQLGVEGALRGRDVNRPSETDLADAERDIVIIRRHWTPPPAH